MKPWGFRLMILLKNYINVVCNASILIDVYNKAQIIAQNGAMSDREYLLLMKRLSLIKYR